MCAHLELSHPLVSVWMNEKHWDCLQRGPLKNQNYLLEGGPLAGFPRQVSALGTHLYQGTSWHCCKRLYSASVNFFLIFQCICPFHERWFTVHLPPPCWVFSSFLAKNSMTPMPHPPYSPDLTLSTFFLLLFPWWKESSKRNILPMWKRWNKQKEKKQKHLKGIKINKFKNYFEEWQKVSLGVLP